MGRMAIASGVRQLALVPQAAARSDFGAGTDRVQLCLMPAGKHDVDDELSAAKAKIADIVSSAMSGNDEAFEQLHDRYSHGLVRFFLKRTAGRLELADELSQKTWVLVWRALRDGRYDPGRAAISTFVYAVGQNVWLQHRRSSAAGPMSGGDFEDFSGLVKATEDDPAGELAAAELLDSLREAIGSSKHEHALTSAEREVVRGLEAGHSERGLADRLGVAASTVHARKLSAFGKLRRYLVRRGFGDGVPSASQQSGESNEGSSSVWRVSRE